MTTSLLTRHLSNDTHLPSDAAGDVAVRQRPTRLMALAIALAMVAVASLAVGTKPIPPLVVLDAITDRDSAVTDHLIVWELRLPRTIVGLFVGSALGVAGALMQGLTRNPLADPGLLGVTAGASFAVVVAIATFGFAAATTLVWFAFAGAAIAAVVVFALGSIGGGGATPVRLALAGAAMNALLFALTRAVTLLDQATLDRFRFWAVGSLAAPDTDIAAELAPFVILGLVLAIAATGRLNTLALGDDVARALGTGIGVTRAMTGVAITLLCGTAVAAAGPVAFVGLVIPHAARAIFGPDQRWLIPGSALGGPIMLLGCDVLGRVVARPGEVQVGIMTAAIGGPAFVLLIRRSRMVQV